MTAFQVKGGLLFERLEDGTVLVTTPPVNGTAESFEIELSDWASVVASTTSEGSHKDEFSIPAIEDSFA